MVKTLTALTLAALMAAAAPATGIAHSGGTDDQGCHENHDTGDYHCH